MIRWLAVAAALAACSSKSREPEPKPEPLRSGVALSYQLELPDGADPDATCDTAAAAVRARLAAIGQERAEVVCLGDHLDLLVADADVAAHARQLFEQQGHLEIRAVVANHPAIRALVSLAGDPDADRAGVRREIDQWSTQTGYRDDNYLSAPSRSALVEYIERAKPALPPDHALVYEKVEPAGQQRGEVRWRSYLVGERAGIADHIADARVTMDTYSNQPVVTVSFDDEGTRRFADFTTRHAGDKLVILVNGEVSSAPVLQEPITGGKVWVNLAERDPAVAMKTADQLATTLRMAALPVPMRLMKVEPWPAAQP